MCQALNELNEKEQAELNEFLASLDEGYFAGDDLPVEQEPLTNQE